MTTYYKLLRPDLKHYDFIYKEGLNVLIQSFNPDPDCGKGGLYFSDLDNIFKWLHIYHYNPDLLIAYVCLPEDAQIVSIDKNNIKKYKSDKIILSNIQRLDNLLSDTDVCIKAVEQDGMALQYIKNQTETICIKAVKHDGMALKYVKPCFYNLCLKI
jgi:hypothetical protein